MKKLKKAIITIVVVVIVLGILFISGIFDQKEDVQIVTESNLHKIIEVSQLSTYECVYNDICTVMDEDVPSKVAYYCKYKGRVKAGIDFTKVDIKMEEQEKILSILVINVINLFAPSVVVIGGAISKYIGLSEMIQEKVDNLSLNNSTDRAKVSVSHLDMSFSLRSMAGELCKECFFTN